MTGNESKCPATQQNRVDSEHWYAELELRFESAAHRVGTEDRWYRIGDLVMHLVFAGQGVQRIVCPAFEHLAIPTPDDGSELKIDFTAQLFAEQDAGHRLPPPPVSLESFSARGDIAGLNNAACKASLQPFGKIISAYLVEQRRAVIYYGDLSSVYNFERASPLRSLLGWVMRGHGRQLVHAGVVSHLGQGLLLGGKGGSGKSNTALACLAADMEFLGDDFCSVASEPELTAYSLFGTGRTRTEDMERLPFLKSLFDRTESFPQDKELYLLARSFPKLLIPKCRLRAVLLPRVAVDRELSLEPASRREALLALAPITTTLLPDSGPEVIQNLGVLVRSLPAYRLYLGPDIAKVPHFLRQTIQRLSAPIS